MENRRVIKLNINANLAEPDLYQVRLPFVPG